MKVLFDDVKEMSTWQLAHNMFFVKEVGSHREAWHRDFEREVSCRDLAREICKALQLDVSDEFMEDDETFDDVILDWLVDGHDSTYGIVAMYYQTMWAFAENRAIAMRK